MNQLTQQGIIVIEGRATYERILASTRDVEPSEAIRQIQNFLKVYPEFAQAHNDLAVLYYNDGNQLKALAHYEKAHKLDPMNITFRKNLADFYFVELEWADDAIHTYLDILKDNPFDVETLNALGTISVQVGRREQARQYFTRTLQLDALNSQARQALQQLGGQLQAPPQQIRISSPAPQPQTPWTTAAPAAPPAQPAPPVQPAPACREPLASPEQLHHQALEQANAGNAAAARRTLEELLASYPAYAVAHNDLGVLCQQDGDLQHARRHHEEANRLQPDNQVFLKNLADLLYIAFGETETAMQLYVRILGNNPRDIETLKAISGICLEIGQTANARTFLESILKIEPWNSEAREALAAISDSQQSRPAVSATFRTADEMHAEAVRLARDNYPVEALSLLEELAHTHAGHALGQNDLGVLRHRLGDSEGAGRAYERAVDIQPGNPTFRKNLADLYFTELGRVDDAIHIYLDLFKQHPRDVEILASLGQICTAVGRPDEARSFYRRALEIEPWSAEIRAALQALP